MYAVGFEPTKHIARELESRPFDRSGMRTKISHTGTRTRVGWVKTSYPNLLDYMGKTPSAGFEPATYRLTAERSAN